MQKSLIQTALVIAAAVALLLIAILLASGAHAQDYPLKSERPRPATATLVGVCEHRERKLMVAIFTFENGKTLIVDGMHMQGFDSAEEIVRYANSAAAPVNEYAQPCGDAATRRLDQQETHIDVG
jgi:hypothetical protein